MNELRVEIWFGNALRITELPAPSSGKQLITTQFGNFTLTSQGDHVMYTLPVDHSVLMQVAYVDARGNPATIDGEIAWESSDEAIITIEVDSQDTTLCRATPKGEIGQAQITATVDADLGDGVRELVTLCDIEVIGGEAVAGRIQPLGDPDQIEPHPEQNA